ncbi:MAG TPA: SPOR domain-containing protein, partial [Novosphingobium sp.]
DQTMPDDMAQSIAPYLRYMEKLTPAQQAAAANLGRFPRAADIGRDDPRVAAYSSPRRPSGVDGALVPAGKPLGRGRTARLASDERAGNSAPDRTPPPVFGADRTAPSVPAPTRQTTPAPALAMATPPERRAASTRPTPPAATLPPASTPAPVALVPGGGFDLARVDGVRQPATAPASSPPAELPAAASPGPVPVPAPVPAVEAVAPRPVPAPAVEAVAPRPVPAPAAASAPPSAPPPKSKAPAAAAPRRGLSEAFADLAVTGGPVTPAPGAVDVRKLAAAKAKAAKPVEPPKPVYPSRVWVQVGTGRNLAALGFTWKQLVKDNPALFKGKSPSTADWGRTNRLLAGPFSSQDTAEAWLAKLKKAGLDAFLWLSEKGEKVDDL